MKCLLGIISSGMSSVQSNCYDGSRPSDTFIASNTDFLKLVKPTNEFMAGKGIL